MQAQDYLGALWAVGLRFPGSTEAEVEQALADRSIVRTWPMRGTLHFVAAEDVRWMLQLLTPRVIAGSAGRHRQLELGEDTFGRSAEVFIKTLEGGKQLVRSAMLQSLEDAKISTAGQRGIQILGRLAQEGLICFGPREGKQQTFVLLDEWIPESKILEGDEALVELAKRYFTGHGPATAHDLAWWSGLRVADARAAVELVGTALASGTSEGKTFFWGKEPGTSRTTHVVGRTSGQRVSGAERGADQAPSGVYMLPGFDELIVGYRDRSAIIDPADVRKIQPGTNGMFSPTIVADGRVVGTWKRTFKKDSVAVVVSPFEALSRGQEEEVLRAAQRYGDFVGLPLEL